MLVAILVFHEYSCVLFFMNVPTNSILTFVLSKESCLEGGGAAVYPVT